MANQRVQVLSSAEQNLFRPEAPVWVSQYQLCLEKQSNRLMLKLRLLNCSDLVVNQVFLRIVCFDANHERISQQDLVPMAKVSAAPGEFFGEDYPVEIRNRETLFVEAYAQRVRFDTEAEWNETDPEGYLSFPRQVVSPDSPDYRTLDARAQTGHVRNDCLFSLQADLWVCTCGTPNALVRSRCVHCGADRLWLEQNMYLKQLHNQDSAELHRVDSELLRRAAFAAPGTAPVDTASFVCPAPIVSVLPSPIYDSSPYHPLPPESDIPLPEPVKADSAQDGATQTEEAAEKPEGKQEQQKREEQQIAAAGKKTALIVAIVAALLVAVICVDRFVMPSLRYQKALREQAVGNYDQAIFLFSALKNYKDSADHVHLAQEDKAREMMRDGKYQEAMDLLEAEYKGSSLIADCIYALGVLAYNDGDEETALEYVARLKQRFPNYDKAETLEQYCYYSLGSRNASEALRAKDSKLIISYYEDAVECYRSAGGYADAEDLAKLCQYRLADAYTYEDVTWKKAIEEYEKLGNYLDAAQLRLDYMYSYVLMRWTDLDDTVFSYLETLSDADYDGAQTLLDQIDLLRSTDRFALVWGEEGEPLPAEVLDLSPVFIRYELPAAVLESPDALADSAPPVYGLTPCVYVYFDSPSSNRTTSYLYNRSDLVRFTDLFPDYNLYRSEKGTAVLSFYLSQSNDAQPLAVLSFEYTSQSTEETENGG